MATYLILGAGLTGLTAARRLQQTGHNVTVLDKGRGVGGRLATRRLNPGKADHGAQYFSAKTSEFQAEVAQWERAGVVQPWDLSALGEGFRHPRYVGTAGMSGIAKHLAEGLNVKLSERAVRIETTETGWAVHTETGGRYVAERLISTLPVPQLLTLLDDSGVTLPGQERSALERIVYEPCFAVMATLRSTGLLPAPGALKFEEPGYQNAIGWMVDNVAKGISPDQPTLTLHASHTFSRQHLEDDPNVVGEQLLAAIADFISPDNVVNYQTHRWRYANATVRHPEPFLKLTTLQPLLVGGDAFGPGNVEGAFLSGTFLSSSGQ